MKKIKFLVTTMLMAIVPMLFTSCEEKPEPTPEVSIIGSWECVNAVLKQDTDPTGGESASEKGQVWKFDETKLTIDNKTYDYTLSNNTLITSYAALYETDHFQVDTLTLENLILSASYVEETKVGDIDITVILTFKRLSE
jgi:hypothetical protein